jgi:hypothetical protein
MLKEEDPQLSSYSASEREDYMRKMQEIMHKPAISRDIWYNAPPDPIVSIDNVYYFKHIYKIQLLHQVGAITPKEAARLVSMLDSDDSENWIIAEKCIKQKFSEL